MKNGNHGYYVAHNPNRILNIKAAKDALFAEKFTAKDIRGLSKAEKAFIAENDNKRVYRPYEYDSEYFVMFIQKDTLGRKRLYAYNNVQVMFPNGKDIVRNYEGSCFYNYECWLTFNTNYTDHFSKFRFEYRFTSMPLMKSTLFFN